MCAQVQIFLLNDAIHKFKSLISPEGHYAYKHPISNLFHTSTSLQTTTCRFFCIRYFLVFTTLREMTSTNVFMKWRK